MNEKRQFCFLALFLILEKVEYTQAYKDLKGTMLSKNTDSNDLSYSEIEKCKTSHQSQIFRKFFDNQIKEIRFSELEEKILYKKIARGFLSRIELVCELSPTKIKKVAAAFSLAASALEKKEISLRMLRKSILDKDINRNEGVFIGKLINNLLFKENFNGQNVHIIISELYNSVNYTKIIDLQELAHIMKIYSQKRFQEF